MLGRIVVRDAERGVQRVDDQEPDLAHRVLEDTLARQGADLLPHGALHLPGERLGRGDQERLSVRTVLRLGQKIGGDELCAGMLVGDHHDLGDSGGQIRRGALGIAGHQRLRGRNPGVPRAE